MIAGLKLGLFAALGGGVMGYTTGKMFEEHGETQNMIKDQYCEVDGGGEGGKTKKTRKRIEEWEKFEANCQKLKQQRSCRSRQGSVEEAGLDRIQVGGAQ